MENKKDTIYFNHDFNSRNDNKIIKLRKKYKWDGYGVFWATLEIMRETTDGMQTYSDCIDNAFQLNLDEEWYTVFINDCIEFGLFIRKGEYVYSQRLLSDIEHMKSKSKKASASASARWDKVKGEKSEGNAIALPTHSDSNAKEDSIGEDKKGENSKGEEEKPVAEPPAVPPLKEIDLLVPELRMEYVKMVGFIFSQPKLQKIPSQLAPDEYEKLRENYTEEQIMETLKDMGNYKDIGKKQSIYLTANKWLKKNAISSEITAQLAAFENEYRTFIVKQSNGAITEPKLSKYDKTDLSCIVTFLKDNSKEKTFESAKAGFVFILDNWSKLDSFTQKRVKLSEINKDKLKIITELRKVPTNERITRQNSSTGAVNNQGAGVLQERKDF
ncbi:MAG: DUF4373 domain-containing protein [Acinetobacter sp.]|uniref:Lin1244/Lin1753 domain-containing protein n=1 Tax=Acinetobacter sp. TaxID=472 RepID=UPI000F9AA469|nr:Lin1244/Lin1753 domain-containing protein [Acinetobacter sp.]RUP38244.1 MAG: DUF4373 domain-containing protein [Acinetobacter sp.]